MNMAIRKGVPCDVCKNLNMARHTMCDYMLYDCRAFRFYVRKGGYLSIDIGDGLKKITNRRARHYDKKRKYF